MMGAERDATGIRCHSTLFAGSAGLLVHRFSSRDLTTLVRSVLLATCTSKPILANFQLLLPGRP
jgi:hypothetical protein